MTLPAADRLHALLPRAARRAAQWRPLLLLLVAGWVPTALLAVPLWRVLADNLDNSVHAAQWAQRLDLVMATDTIAQLTRAGSALAGAAIASLLLTLLLIPFQDAVLVTAARTNERLRLGELLHAGLREYGPMLRLLLVSLLPLALALGLSALAFKGVNRYAAHAVLADDVDRLGWLADALAAVLVITALAGVEAGRARFAYDPRKRSAFKAWWRGVKLVFRHPLRSYGVVLGISVPALLAAAVLGLARLELSTAGAGGFIAGWLIVQLLATVLNWAHLARLSGLYEVTRVQQEAATRHLRPTALA
jgi:hypothetical protein